MAARIDQINNISGFPEKVKNVPPNYPTQPGPGKISLLFKYNKENLWHRFSPYTYGDNVFGVFRNKQPFVYRYPDEAQNSTFNQLPAAVKTLAASGNITRDTLDDVVRVSKLLVTSPEGALYNIKQYSLQRLNVFDETRVNNPLSPVLATISGMTFGIGERPRRHIEGGILMGLLNSVTSTVGINFQSQFKKPDSTAGDTTALPTSNVHEGKGMIRGKTSADALATLTSKWPNSPGVLASPLGLGAALSKAASSFIDSAKNSLTAFFGNVQKPSNVDFRADEKAFKLMRDSKGKLDYYNRFGAPISYPSSVVYHPGFLYKKDDVTEATPIILSAYKEFVSDKNKSPYKFSDPTQKSATDLNADLQKVIDSINLSNVYYVSKVPASYLLPSAASSGVDYVKYDNWKKKQQGAQKIGTSGEYFDNRLGKPKTVDASVSPNNNLRMATSFKSDALNRIGVLNKNKAVSGIEQYPDYTEYKPYEDDLIAFFFYDVVNQKYIPFRATVKGISEGGTAFWDELRFIGRADQLYSYNGFSRTLSFTFNIVVSSLSELLPTWQKVNYMASSVKPSNYTTGAKFGDNRYSRFIVPPMFMLTIGDMYKFQPIVITSVNVNIPDDAVWETLNEDNSKEWSYLNGIIRSPGIGKKYAQIPREAEIAITCNLLEKERAMVGGSHFGHAPVSDENDKVFVTGKEPYLPNITVFDEALVTTNK